MIYAISRKKISVDGVIQIESVDDLRKLPKGSEVLLVGPVPFEFQNQNAMLTAAQERNFTLKALQANR